MTIDHSTGQIPPAVRAEAAAWVARLHSDRRSTATESGFRRWLEAAPAHAQAFELATEAWNLAEGVTNGVNTSSQERNPQFLNGLAAACVLVAAALGISYWLENVGSAVSTKIGEQRTVILDDGSRVYLNTDTHLRVDEDEFRRRVQLDRGEALFEVNTDPKRPFIVTVGTQEVVALGTSFVVRKEPRYLSVTLMEGRVQVGVIEPRVLTHGQRVTYIGNDPPRIDEPSVPQLISWTRGEVVLDNTRLQDAVNEMNRYSAKKLVLDEAELGNVVVGGVFRAGDSDQFARAVGATFGWTVYHERNQIVLSQPHKSK